MTATIRSRTTCSTMLRRTSRRSRVISDFGSGVGERPRRAEQPAAPTSPLPRRRCRRTACAITRSGWNARAYVLKNSSSSHRPVALHAGVDHAIADRRRRRCSAASSRSSQNVCRDRPAPTAPASRRARRCGVRSAGFGPMSSSSRTPCALIAIVACELRGHEAGAGVRAAGGSRSPDRA